LSAAAFERNTKVPVPPLVNPPVPEEFIEVLPATKIPPSFVAAPVFTVKVALDAMVNALVVILIDDTVCAV